jgi:hypothetical protein
MPADPMTRFIELVSRARANRIRRLVNAIAAAVLAHRDGDAPAKSPATRTDANATPVYTTLA